MTLHKICIMSGLAAVIGTVIAANVNHLETAPMLIPYTLGMMSIFYGVWLKASGEDDDYDDYDD